MYDWVWSGLVGSGVNSQQLKVTKYNKYNSYLNNNKCRKDILLKVNYVSFGLQILTRIIITAINTQMFV